MTTSLYFCGILGPSDPVEDDWMVTDIAVATALVENPATNIHLFTTVPFHDFSCSHNGYLKFGDHRSDRLEVPVPDDSIVTVNRNGSTLKSIFLQKIYNVTKGMKPTDKLIVFIAAHGAEDGHVMIGKEPLTISDVASSVQNNATTILWSTACFSGKWLEGKVPWHGYVGAAAYGESDSLVVSDSNYNRGGVSMLTTFATLAADQNAVIPLPYRTHCNSDQRPHYYDEPTVICEPRHRSLEQRAALANETKNELSYSYDADTTADSRTQRPLFVPHLTSEVLNRFRLFRQSPEAPTSASQSRKTSCFRQAIEQVPPVPGLDIHELLVSGAQLLEARVSQGGLVFLSRRLQKSSFEEADILALCSVFDHRRRCRVAVESYIDWAGWKTSRPPRWDFSGGGVAAEFKMVGDDQEAEAWRAFFCWRPEVPDWRVLTWTDIRQQLALAWEAAEKPHFSAAHFLAVASHMDDLKKEKILTVASPTLQAAVHYISKIFEYPLLQDDSGSSAAPASFSAPASPSLPSSPNMPSTTFQPTDARRDVVAPSPPMSPVPAGGTLTSNTGAVIDQSPVEVARGTKTALVEHAAAEIAVETIPGPAAAAPPMAIGATAGVPSAINGTSSTVLSVPSTAVSKAPAPVAGAAGGAANTN
jgi:hypothetical protein